MRVGEDSAGAVRRRHLRAHLDGALEEPGFHRSIGFLPGLDRLLHGRHDRQIDRDAGVPPVADGVVKLRDPRALVHEHEVDEDRAWAKRGERVEHHGVAPVGDRIGLLQAPKIVLPEQEDGRLLLAEVRVRVLDDAVDDRLRPRREVTSDAMEDEQERSDEHQRPESDQHPGQRARTCHLGPGSGRRGRLGLRPRLAH